MRFGEHLFEVGKQESTVEAVSLCVLRKQALVRFGDADDFNLGAVQRCAKKSVNVSVNQADDADAQRRLWAGV